MKKSDLPICLNVNVLNVIWNSLYTVENQKKPFSIIESDDLMQFFLFFFGQRNFTIILQLLAPIYAKRFVKYEVQFTGSLYAMWLIVVKNDAIVEKYANIFL